MSNPLDPNQSSNKYYASGQKSVIVNSEADMMNSGPVPPPVPNYRNMRPGDPNSSDIYYKAQKPVSRQPLAERPLAKNIRVKRIGKTKRHDLLVETRLDIADVCARAVTKVQYGQPVTIECDDGAFMALQTYLDSLASREVITHDQRRDISIMTRSETMTAVMDAAVGPPIPKPEKPQEPTPDPFDFLAQEEEEGGELRKLREERAAELAAVGLPETRVADKEETSLDVFLRS